MNWSDELKPTIKRIINLIEIERFTMGMGKYEFSRHIGVAYHTYNMFITERQMITPNTFQKILKFLEFKGKSFLDIPVLELSKISGHNKKKDLHEE